MNERIAALRHRALSSWYDADPEAERLRKQSLELTVGEPAVIREAKASAHHNRHRAIAICDGELIVGARPALRHGEAPQKQLAFGRRTFASPWPAEQPVDALFREGTLSPAGNHTTMDYDTIMATGFKGLAERVDRRLARLESDAAAAEGKRQFLQALKIVAEGYLELCRRYADLAMELARGAADATRKQELETIAEHCRRVPALPPRNFWEACQCAWFAFLFLPDAPGRVDQYLYPFYQRDVEQGRLSREFAQELLSCLWMKYFEVVAARSGVSAHNHLTLGGTTPDGRDGCNELTDLCLNVTEDLRLQRPQVGLRWHPRTPPACSSARRACCAAAQATPTSATTSRSCPR